MCLKTSRQSISSWHLWRRQLGKGEKFSWFLLVSFIFNIQLIFILCSLVFARMDDCVRVSEGLGLESQVGVSCPVGAEN